MYDKIKIFFLCFFYVGFYTQPAIARPVSYPDGYMIMQENNVNSNKLQVNYSFTASSSVGYIGEYWRDLKWQFHGVQVNHLLRRWNMKKSQANFYVTAAGGAAYINKDNFARILYPAGLTGVMLDWEDRDYYVSYENQIVYAQQIQTFFMQKARVGITPYVGNYGDLHTWFMLEVSHNPQNSKEIIATPLVRFFQEDFLLEVGVSHYGDMFLNWVVIF